MEQINAIADQFFALPYISSFFQSNAMLRVAANSYGTPLFLIFCALIFLIVLLLISKLMPKKGRPKPIKEDKPKKTPRNAPQPRRKKPTGTPKTILRKLEKLPESKLPLYPVADKKRRSLNENIDDAIEMDQPAAATPQMTPERNCRNRRCGQRHHLWHSHQLTKLILMTISLRILQPLLPAQQNNLPLMRHRSMTMRQDLMICSHHPKTMRPSQMIS